MTNYEQKLENFMFSDIKGKKNLTILMHMILTIKWQKIIKLKLIII